MPHRSFFSMYLIEQNPFRNPQVKRLNSIGLKWLPENYRRLLGEAMLVKSFSVKDFSRRLGAVRELWCGILPKIREETGLTTELISKYYVEKVLHQS
jgi:hypothetical protein